ETVAADEEDVLHTAVFQVGHHGEPELRALGLLEPEAEDLALAGDRHAECDVDGLLLDDAAVTDRDEERVEIDDGVDGFERAPLPGLGLLENGLGDLADELRGDLGAIQLLQMALDFP